MSECDRCRKTGVKTSRLEDESRGTFYSLCDECQSKFELWMASDSRTKKSEDVLLGLQTRLKGLIPKESWDEWDGIVNGIAEYCTLITVIGMLNDKFGAEKVKFTLNWLEKVV